MPDAAKGTPVETVARRAADASAARPFDFWRAAFLVEVTSLKATSLSELLTCITLADTNSIFYHLHQRFFREPDILPEYPNDFAAWADGVLGDHVVAERLANLSLFRSADLEVVRREIAVILAERLHASETAGGLPQDGAFIFCQARLVLFRSGRQVSTAAEFLAVLREIDTDAIGAHLFAPRMAMGTAGNDFAACFRRWGYETIAAKIDAFDPYLNSLEDNRHYLIELVETGLGEAQGEGRHA
jgi:hypothetical protein